MMMGGDDSSGGGGVNINLNFEVKK
jgi:hypothetical protein